MTFTAAAASDEEGTSFIAPGCFGTDPGPPYSYGAADKTGLWTVSDNSNVYDVRSDVMNYSIGGQYVFLPIGKGGNVYGIRSDVSPYALKALAGQCNIHTPQYNVCPGAEPDSCQMGLTLIRPGSN